MRKYALLVFLLVVPFAAAGCRGSKTRSDRHSDANKATVIGEATSGGIAAESAEPTGEVETDAEDGEALAGNVVATVNDEAIALGDFQRQAFETQRYFVDQGLDANTAEGQQQLLYLRKQVLDDMINQVLLEQAAVEMGISATETEVDERMAGYAEELGGEAELTASYAERGTTPDEVREMERSAIVVEKLVSEITADLPTTAEAVHARHILCTSESACQAALARLESGEAFDTLAKELSSDETSASLGGDLDWISRGILPSAQLEDEIFKLEAGQRSGVVHTDFGYHILEVLERDPARELSAEQRYTQREKKLMDWLDERRQASTIEVFVEDLRDVSSGSDSQ